MKRIHMVLIAGMACVAGSALATRPLTIDDADPTPDGQCQLTAGVGLEHTGSHQDWDYPFGVAYGIASNLEINASFGVVRAEIEDGSGNASRKCGIGDLLLGAKWQFLSETDWLPRQTLEPAVKIPTASHSDGLDSGRPDYDLTWVASKKLGEKVQADINVGYTLVGHPKDEPEDDLLHGGAALEYQLCDTWQWVGEVLGNRDLRGDGHLSVLCDTGLRWQLAEGLTADMAIGTGLRGEDVPHLTGTVGLTWLFVVTN